MKKKFNLFYIIIFITTNFFILQNNSFSNENLDILKKDERFACNLFYKKIEESTEIVSKMTGAEINWKSTYACPGVVNDKGLTDLILSSSRQAIGDENVEILDVSSMGGEDFAYYLEKIPGAYFRIGSYDGIVDDIHTSDFNVDEECIFTGIKAFVSIANNYYKS